MRDFVREMMDTWATNGDQSAYDLGVYLLEQIEVELRNLRTQATAIEALRHHLEEAGDAHVQKPVPTLDTVRVVERPRLIIEAAMSIWEDLPVGNDSVKVQDVLQALNGKGLDLGVKQPLAVIGTVLANSNEFRKVARNTFEFFQDDGPPTEDDDE